MEDNEFIYKIFRNGYEILIYGGVQELSQDDTNFDVEIVFNSGQRYVATFFTLKNIQTIFEKNKITGECGKGLYFWASDMVILETMSEEKVIETIETIIAEKELNSAFTKVSDRSEEK